MKLRSKKGFTLMEMLIVVGIIAVLVAVSIPVFSTQLEKAREAADISNMRSAKAEAVAQYLLENQTGPLNYDARKGKFVSGTSITPYGKGTAANGGTLFEGYDATKDYTNSYIIVTIDNDGEVQVKWSGVDTATTTNTE